MPIPTMSPVILTRARAHSALDAGFAKADELVIPFTTSAI